MTKSSKLILLNEKKLLQEEKERLRKLRIIQVREISKQNAVLVRNAFKAEKNREIKNLLNKHQATKNEQTSEQLNEMRQMVDSHVHNIGQGHSSAVRYDQEGRQEAKLRELDENNAVANLRGQYALAKHIEERKVIENKENAHIISRNFALEQEKLRAYHVARLPRPESIQNEEELNKLIGKKPGKVVKLHEANLFAETRYHMPETVVEKMDSIAGLSFDARKEAGLEEGRLKEAKEEIERTGQERLEKARLRGKHALEKEVLHDNYKEILGELGVLEKADREKRQKELGNIPKEIFVPSWQRDHDKKEMQYDLERQFEKIYADSNLRKEDDIPQPVDLKQLEMSQSNLDDTDLDLTIVDEASCLTAPNEEIDEPVVTDGGTTLTNVSLTTSSKQENLALNKLLNKIRKQRDDLNSLANCKLNVSVAVSDSEKECENMWTPNSTQNHEVLSSDKSEKSNEFDIITNENDNTEMSASSSEISSDSCVTSKSGDKNTNTQNKKLIRGIMMSSHNVSSLHEIETRFCLNKRNNRNDDQQTVYSACLSHASRDQMVAGSNELFNAKDKRREIEKKQELLQKKQEDLEKKLKDLEEKEAELEKNNVKLTVQNNEVKPASVRIFNSKITSSGGIDSGNDHNYCSSDTSTLTTPPVTARLPGISQEDLKRIEYQEMILKKTMVEKNLIRSKLPNADTGEFSSSSSASIDSMTQRIEQRKLELLKRFDIQITDDQQQNPLIQNQIQRPVKAKTSVYSSDSGAFSTASTTNFSQVHTSDNNTNNLNAQVGRLNTEVLNLSGLSRAKHELVRQQQQVQLAEYLGGQIDEIEYRNRMAALVKFQATETGVSEINKKEFGLEFFDPLQNMSQVRDMSIENLFNWSNSRPAGQASFVQQNQQQSLRNLSNDDTLNDDDTSTSSCDSDLIFSKTDISEDEDSQALILSLLNTHKNQQKQLSTSNYLQDKNAAKRQFIQDQLELIRKQREQLNQSAVNNTSNSSQANKSSRMSGVNLNLSTIKEVDTPKSERNLKLQDSLVSQHDNSTLETVTKINETPRNNSNTLKSISMSSMMSDTSVSTSTNNSSGVFKKPLAPPSQENSFTSTSTSTPVCIQSGPRSTLELEPVRLLMSNSLIREKQLKLFNASLFDYESSDETQQVHQQQHITVDYAAKIYDDLSSVNNSASLAFKSTSFSVGGRSGTGKKWFDILSADDENTCHSERINSMNSEVMQQQILSSRSTISSGRGEFSLHQTSSMAGSHATNADNSDEYSMSLIQQPLSKSDLSDTNKTRLSHISDNLSSYTSNTSSTHSLIEQHLTKLNDSTSLHNNSSMNRTLQQYNPPAKQPSSLTKKSLSTEIHNNKANQTASRLNSASASTLEDCISSRTIDSCSSYTHSYPNNSQASSDLANPSNKNSEASNGMFDRFIKNYNSSSSIQDEPDLSFVSSQGMASNQTSPLKQQLQATHYSYSTSGVSSNSLTTTAITGAGSIGSNSGLEKTMDNLSLIQFQQKQLMKQFANMSPIGAEIGSELQEMSLVNHNSADRSDLQSTKINGDCTASLVMFTPASNRNFDCKKHTSVIHEISSLIQCPIRETPERPDDFLSINQIESALKATNLSCLEQASRSKEKIKPSSLQSNQTKDTELFSNIVFDQNPIEINDSLASFEQHELTQSTPSQFYQITNLSSMAASPGPAIFNASEINEKSTPFVQIFTTNRSRTPSPQSCQSVEDYKEKFQKFLDNLNTSDLQMFGGDVKARSEHNDDNNTSCYTYSQRELNKTDKTLNEYENDLTILSNEN